LNLFIILGGLLALIGIVLLLKNLFGFAASRLKKRRWERYLETTKSVNIYKSEPDAPPPYKMGESENYAKRMRRNIGLLIVALVVLLPGLYLMKYQSFIEGALVGELRTFKDTPGRLVWMIQPPGKDWVTAGSLPGNFWAVRGRYIVFDDWMKYIGLFSYQRVTAVRTLDQKADLFLQGKGWGKDLVKKDAISNFLVRRGDKIPLVKIFENTTPYYEPRHKDMTLMASRSGYIVIE
jgi:hypothetical protein